MYRYEFTDEEQEFLRQLVSNPSVVVPLKTAYVPLKVHDKIMEAKPVPNPKPNP